MVASAADEEECSVTVLDDKFGLLRCAMYSSHDPHPHWAIVHDESMDEDVEVEWWWVDMRTGVKGDP